MSKIINLVEDKQTSEFYPTPQKVVEKMLSGVDWDFIKTILEPSAGKGDILREIAKREPHGYYGKKFDVDCIEIDPNLRQILKYNFSDERKRQFNERDEERYTFFEKGIHIVHDDFLTYNPFKRYDLIVMNPPFSNGDKHLLKALKMQENGGAIICLLNAETIRNPYTETRKALVQQLERYNANIEYIENGFTQSERRTDVEIALIKVSIENVQEESDIYNRMKEAEEYEDFDPEVTGIEVSDYIKAAVNQFNVEVKSGLELIRQYRALVPYMSRSFGDNTPILRLTDSSDRGYNSVSVNDYVQKVRLKYWKELLSNPKFIGKLTSKLQKEYQEKVNKLADYDFTEFNIYTLSTEMNSHIKSGIENEIIAMFDRLTAEHSYYPEFSKNRHYYDGWKTNSAYKIAKKVIIPCYGIFSQWDGQPRTYDARKALEDIERILNFLDGHMTADVDSWSALESNFKNGITKNIEMKYFKATFYKKGTVHLTFTCPELIDRFNIYAAQNKNWLPPSYGKKSYKDMTADEKKVVDSFQGEKAYSEIMAKSGYYLAPVTSGNQMLMLEAT